MTRPRHRISGRQNTPGVSRGTFIGTVALAVLVYAALLVVTLLAAQSIVNEAKQSVKDGLCLLVKDTPDTVPLALEIRQKYNCPAYVKHTPSPRTSSLHASRAAHRSKAHGRGQKNPGQPQATPGTSKVEADGKPHVSTAQGPPRTVVKTKPVTHTKTTVQTKTTTAQPQPQPSSSDIVGVCVLVVCVHVNGKA